MKKFKKLIVLLITAAIAVTMFALPVSAAGISSAKTFAEGAVLNWSASAKKSDVCYLKMTFSDSGKVKFSIGSQKTTAKSKYQILDSKGNKKYSGKISALAGKEITVNKGTYYLKLTLQKGQYVKKLKYTFTGKSSSKKTAGDWLTGYTLTKSDIEQIEKLFDASFCVHPNKYFSEKELNEQFAVDWFYTGNGTIVYPYSSDARYSGAELTNDVLNKYYGQQLYRYKESVVDNLVFNVFGIKPTHKVEYKYCYYYNGYYYYNPGGVGGFEWLDYKNNEKLNDGRFLVCFNRVMADFDRNWEEVIVGNVYALVSVHKTDGKNYIRLHGVYKNKPSL